MSTYDRLNQIEARANAAAAMGKDYAAHSCTSP